MQIVGLTIKRYYDDEVDGNADWCFTFYAFFNVIWPSLFLELWKRWVVPNIITCTSGICRLLYYFGVLAKSLVSRTNLIKLLFAALTAILAS